jgi:hypothetical protein
VSRKESRLVAELRIAEPLLSLVLQGRKRSTIRRGHVVPVLPLISLVTSSGKEARVVVRTIDYTKTLSSLTDADAVMDGFAGLQELHAALKTFYPDLPADEPLTVIGFHLFEERP